MCCNDSEVSDSLRPVSAKNENNQDLKLAMPYSDDSSDPSEDNDRPILYRVGEPSKDNTEYTFVA